MPQNIEIHRIDNQSLDDIADLWECLKKHHLERTHSFAEHYLNNTFERRKAELLRKDQLAVFVAGAGEVAGEGTSAKLLGFCVASVTMDVGEIDSLYTDPSVRNQQFGQRLMQQGLNWLDAQKVKHIRLMVAEGNEDVLGFYEKFGFRKRATQLERK